MDHLLVEEFLCVCTECQFKTSVMNSERNGCVCVCVAQLGSRDWYSLSSFQIPNITAKLFIIVMSVQDFANSFHSAPLKTRSSFKTMSLCYIESHFPMLNTLPCEFMLIFYLLHCSSKLLSLPFRY